MAPHQIAATARAHLQRRRRRRRWLAAALACATIGIAVVLFEESMIYFPTAYPDGQWDTEAHAAGTGLVLEDCFFTTEDGVKLHAWWCRPQAEDEAGGARPLLLLFHGNAGNLSHRGELVLLLARRLAIDVMIVGYRGYGRSEGRPSELGLQRDARAAWRYATRERGVAAQRVVLLGESLGGAVAVRLASEVEPAGLIVQSSFTSIRELAAHHYPIVPGGLIRTRMDSLLAIRDVTCPKLFIHGTADDIVPYRLGRSLYDAAPPPKRFLPIDGAGHNDVLVVDPTGYLTAVDDFIRRCAP